MSNTKTHTKPYGSSAAYARKEAALDKKKCALAKKRNLLLAAFKADPTNMGLREKYECADIDVENALYAMKVHYNRYFKYVY